MKKRLFLLLILVIGFIQVAKSQINSSLSPELLFGKTFQPHSYFPEFPNNHFMIGLNYGRQNLRIKKDWESVLNLSSTGIGIYYSSFGNAEVVGDAIILTPFIDINLNKKESLILKLGLGTSYFFKKYDPITNPENIAVSTNFTWAFQTFMFYNIDLKNKRNLRVGIGALHNSNGHTKLPNTGLNSVLMSVSTNFDLKQKEIKEDNKVETEGQKIKKAFYSIRYGQGFQEFYAEGSDVKAVNSLEIFGGYYYKKILKFSAGATYSFYKHYYDYIVENELDPYYENPGWNASNIYLTIGVEALLGRISIDWEGGLNIYKPFYKEHSDLEGKNSESISDLKQLFLGRLGLKLYLINTMKNPENNFYVGVHIKSNLSQADYTDISIGYTHNIFKK